MRTRRIDTSSLPPRRERFSFRGWIARPEVIISLVAIVIGVCSLSVAVYETSLVRRGQIASVWPHVEVAPSVNPDRISLFVVNSGVGPARIEAASVSYAGEPVEGWVGLVYAAGGGAPLQANDYQSIINGRVLPAGTSETTFRLEGEGPAFAAFTNSFRARLFDGTLDVSVCYCSVFDECWVATAQEVVARSRGERTSRESRRVRHCRDHPVSGI